MWEGIMVLSPLLNGCVVAADAPRPRGDKKRPKAPLAAGSQAVSLSFLACDGKHETAENQPLGKAFWIVAGSHRQGCKDAAAKGESARWKQLFRSPALVVGARD